MTDLGFRRGLLYVAKKLVVECVHGHGKPLDTRTGTGFVIRHQASGDGAAVYRLVTNRHVVDPTYASQKYVGQEISVTRVAISASELCRKHGQHSVDVEPAGPDEWIYPDTDDDVAVLLLRETDVPEVEGCEIGWSSVSSTLIAPASAFDDQDPSRSIEPGDVLAIPSYPMVDGSQQQRPVASFGYIASDPSFAPDPPIRIKGRPMRGTRVVLYQGFSRGGASGAPVFAVRRGLPPDFIDGQRFATLAKTLGHSDFSGRPLRLIGINGGHVSGNHQEPSALSYFIRSDAILNALDQASGQLEDGCHS